MVMTGWSSLRTWPQMRGYRGQTLEVWYYQPWKMHGKYMESTWKYMEHHCFSKFNNGKPINQPWKYFWNSGHPVKYIFLFYLGSEDVLYQILRRTHWKTTRWVSGCNYSQFWKLFSNKLGEKQQTNNCLDQFFPFRSIFASRLPHPWIVNDCDISHSYGS